MQRTTSRTIAVVGVLATGVLAASLVIPASRLLGSDEGLWQAAALLLAPTIVLLVVTGFPYYGVLRSVAVAVVVMVITGIVTFVISAFAFATALSGSVTGILLAIVLFGGPALSVVVLGLLALRFVGAGKSKDRESAHVG